MRVLIKTFNQLALKGLTSCLVMSFALSPLIVAPTLIMPSIAMASETQMPHDYYYVLGLNPKVRLDKNGRPNFTTEEITKALRKKLVSLGDMSAWEIDSEKQELRRRIIEAANVLRDPDSRAKYDQAWDYRSNQPRPQYKAEAKVQDGQAVPSRRKMYNYQARYQFKTMPLEMLVFMLSSTAVGMGFAAAEGDWEKVALIRDQLGEAGSWAGFGTFAIGQGLSSWVLGSVFGSVIAPAFIGQFSTAFGVGADHLFRNLWYSEEFAKAWINWGEWSHAKKNLLDAQRQLKITEEICNQSAAKDNDRCTKELPQLKTEHDTKLASFNKFRERYWKYHMQAYGSTFLPDEQKAELAKKEDLGDPATWPSMGKLSMTPKEREEFTHSIAHLFLAATATTYVMKAGHVVNGRYVAPVVQSMNERYAAPFFRSAVQIFKGAPVSGLPAVIYPEGAASFLEGAIASSPGKKFSWVVRDASGKLLWSSTMTSGLGSSSKYVLNLFKSGLGYMGRRVPHLLAFLTTMELTGASWNDIAKTLQLRGVHLWPGNFTLTGNNIKNVKDGVKNFVAAPNYASYYQFDKAISDYADDWLVWNDKIVFTKVTEVFGMAEGKLAEERVRQIKSVMYLDWFLNSFQKFGKPEVLDTNDPVFVANNEGGFEWHPDSDSKAYLRELYHPDWGHYVQFRKHYIPQLMKDGKYLTGKELVDRIAQIKENYKIHVAAELEKKSEEINSKMIKTLPYELQKAFYGVKPSMMTESTWDSFDTMRSEHKGLMSQINIYSRHCAIYRNKTSEICTKKLPELKSKESELSTRMDQFKNENHLTLGSRIKNWLGLDRLEVPLYKAPRSMPESQGRYNYTDSLDNQYRIFRDIYLELGLVSSPYADILTNALKSCPQLKSSERYTCVYDLAQALKRMAAFDVNPVFSAKDVTLPLDFRRLSSELQAFKNEYSTVRVSNNFSNNFNDTARSDAVAAKFARVFSHLTSEFILIPPRKARMSRVEIAPFDLNEFYIDPFIRADMEASLKKDKYYFYSRDVRNAKNLVELESTRQSSELIRQTYMLTPDDGGEQFKVSFSDLQELLTDEVAGNLEWRVFKIVDPRFQNNLEQANQLLAMNGNSLEAYRAYLNALFPENRIIRLVVTRATESLRKLGLRDGDIIEFVDTIQNDKLQPNEISVNVQGRENLAAWIDNIQRNKFKMAYMVILRDRHGVNVNSNRNFVTNNGHDGFLEKYWIQYSVFDHDRIRVNLNHLRPNPEVKIK